MDFNFSDFVDIEFPKHKEIVYVLYFTDNDSGYEVPLYVGESSEASDALEITSQPSSLPPPISKWVRLYVISGFGDSALESSTRNPMIGKPKKGIS